MRIRKAAQAEQWMQTAELLRKRFQICFWDEERGVFVNGVVDGKKTSRWGCHENTLAILYGLATESQRKRIFERLKQEDLQNVFVPDDNDYDIEIPACGKMPSVSLALSRYRWPDQKMVPLGTPYFAMYWLEALCQAGFVRDAQRFIETRWGELARQGATSVWETWDMRQSLSHAWSCSPAVIAARYFAGVQRKDDSGIRYSILPAPGLLKRIQSRVSTRFGVIQVSWDQERLVIDVPVGLEVEAGLPVQRDHSLRVNGEIPPALGRVRCAGTVYQVALVPPGRSVLTLAGNENRESEQLLNERLSLAGS